MKIYTKTGDDGTTGLFGGPRVSKDDPRITAYGTVDELNALLGVAASFCRVGDGLTAREAKSEELSPQQSAVLDLLAGIQSDLFSIGAQLATPEPEKHGMDLLTHARIEALESAIDEAERDLSPLKNFILPGGSLAASMLHLARTVCRRAERDVIRFAKASGTNAYEFPIVFLNRLSDLLFVLARWQNAQHGVEDIAWKRPTP